MTKIVFFEPERWGGEFLYHIKETLKQFKEKFPKSKFIFIKGLIKTEHFEKIKDCESLVVSANVKVDANVLANMPNLKFVCTISTGFDNIDLDACKKKNIIVTNIPSYGENSVAELAFSLITEASRGIVQDSKIMRNKQAFHKGYLGFDLYGKTIGVLGTGRIGAFSIRIAKGYGMKVIGFDAFPNQKLAQDLDFKYVDLDTALRESDVITVHLPLLPSTKHIINMDSIKKLKPGVVIVNTSRGGIISNQALLYGLENNIIKFAGLDVLDNEELLKTSESNSSELETINKIIKMKNVCVTPHNGFNTEEAVKRRMDVVVENLTAFYSGTPINIVKPFV